MIVTKQKDTRPTVNPGIIYHSKSFENVVSNAVRNIKPKTGKYRPQNTRPIIRMIFSNCLYYSYNTFKLIVSEGMIIDGKFYSKATLANTIKKLVNKGYINYSSGVFIPSSGYYRPSTITPTERLINVISKNCEGVFVKRGYLSRVVIKKCVIDPSVKPTKSVINTIEDDIIEIEERYSKHKINSESQVITMTPLFRIFNENLSSHGRLYSSLTYIKKDKRSNITIDNESTCEIDLTSATINIAIIKSGNLPPKDFYSFHHDRDVAKSVSMVCFYTGTEKWVTNACSKVLWKKYGKKISNMKEVVERTRNWFDINGIGKLFCAGEGIKYMKYEADFCVDLVLSCLREQIPVLSIHDAFICKISDKDRLRLMIDLVYKRHFGVTPACMIKL